MWESRTVPARTGAAAMASALNPTTFVIDAQGNVSCRAGGGMLTYDMAEDVTRQTQ
ncbi:MAG: hypothetical protein ACLR23_15525 [Clostridia bacterium]